MPDATATPDLPPELEQRIAAIERDGRDGRDGDLDAFSWFWLLALGVALPVGLLLWGWWT
jgi:hypothetical protein